MAATNASSSVVAPHALVVDIELTSRCNANCSFCPRDMTPHLGLIDERTFTAALGRAVEYRDAFIGLSESRPGAFDTHNNTIWLSFCGMGEPLIHPRVVEYVAARVAEAGLRPIINTNGALLTPQMADDLMDAGLGMACLNVGEIDEQYDEVYGLPFERTRANVEHFLQVAPGRCLPMIVLVDHRDDPDHVAAMREYWSERGATVIAAFSVVNRGGSLPLEEQTDAHRAFHSEAEKMFEAIGETPRCGVPFLYPFIGYDGNYYLCSSDWRKEVNLGNVFERGLVDLFEDKAERVRTRDPICRDCTHEPTNALALSLAYQADGRSAAEFGTSRTAPEAMIAGLAHISHLVDAMHTHRPPQTNDRRPRYRRLIPLRS